MSLRLKRLSRELKELANNPPAGINLLEFDDLESCNVKMEGAPESLYHGESFTLNFKFPPTYPLDSPEVIFLKPVPVHPHIYSNGHICLSILYDAWTPALTTASVCLSIQSMMSSCTSKQSPDDDWMYLIKTGTKSPKLSSWIFHDDKA